MTAPTTTLESDRARNINLWKDADVYYSDDADAQVNADGTFDTAVWAFVGLLNEGSSIGREGDIERKDIKSFGGKKQMTDVKANKDTRSFTLMEDNATVYEIMWPGSTPYTDDGVSVLAAPKTTTKGIFAFKTVNSFGDVLIDITRRMADAYINSEDRSDDGAETRDVTVDVMEDTPGAWYDRLRIKGSGISVNDALAPIRVKGVTVAGPVDSTATSKTVTLPAGTTGGTFTLTVDGKATAAIEYNADGAAVTSAITTAGATGVTVIGAAGGPYTITGATTVSANGAALTGGDTAISVA